MKNIKFDRLLGLKGGKVYLIDGSFKHWVVNADVIYSLGLDWNSVVYVSHEYIDSFVESFPLVSINQEIFENSDFVMCVEDSWSDDYHVGIKGYLVGKRKKLSKILLEVDGVLREIELTKDRLDIYEYYSKYTKYKVEKKCGFSLLYSRHANHILKVGLNKDSIKEYVYTPERHNVISQYCGREKFLNKKFFELVNSKCKSVLEVGSRISPGGVSKRIYVNNKIDFIGFDYLAGDNVDVVGDAHFLSKYFKGKKFDALFSDSVLEHLAMPWKAMIEMNKCLNIGGFMFHSTPSCWSLHDMPWDFWRFSDAGLRVLCSKAFGFEIIDFEYTCPVKIHIDNVDSDDYSEFSLSPAFGFVQILCKKIADIDDKKNIFDFSLKDVVGNTTYPRWFE